MKWGEEGGLESGVEGGWQVGRLGARGQRGRGSGDFGALMPRVRRMFAGPGEAEREEN